MVLAFSLVLASSVSADDSILSVPASKETLRVSVSAPAGFEGKALKLVEQARGTASAPAFIVPNRKADGSPAEGAGRLVADIPGTSESGERRFKLETDSAATHASSFTFRNVDRRSLGLWENDRPVLVYNHGVISHDGLPEDRSRSSYVHPLYGIEGESLTDDFPADHLHHRGLFWAWPHVIVGGKEYDLWLLKGVHHEFGRWLARDTGPSGALLGIENGWMADGRKLLTERVWLDVHPATRDSRIVDVTLVLEPGSDPVTLDGAAGKSYGGLNLRFAPRHDLVITTPKGNGPDDLLMTKLPWADFSAKFAAATETTGAAILVAPEHPDFPPNWLTRHYGVLCVGWPGVTPKTLEPGRPTVLRYRVWIHRGPADAARLDRLTEAFALEGKAAWLPTGDTKP
ncbi:DUF6807 family protein [Paludisphaera rhizosphaerae]|uniref:DUF6807 family protein n=1 Tax=Paludisphaera rhizosphaerae TaxID=2711216 RepID=UPI0013E9DA81|nr:DUF6807 family protein [Paludisphaera rhizosphaerae]